jgi:hypothetical protein
MLLLQWHPEAEAKVTQNLRLKDEEAAEALASSVQALQDQQVCGFDAFFSLTDLFYRSEWKTN